MRHYFTRSTEKNVLSSLVSWLTMNHGNAAVVSTHTQRNIDARYLKDLMQDLNRKRMLHDRLRHSSIYHI